MPVGALEVMLGLRDERELLVGPGLVELRVATPRQLKAARQVLGGNRVAAERSLAASQPQASLDRGMHVPALEHHLQRALLDLDRDLVLAP